MSYLLTKLEDFAHGDIIRVISHERNCGIDQTVFTALVVESKEDGLIAIPQVFEAYLFRQALNGTGWETSMEWLLENDVEIVRILSYREELEKTIYLRTLEEDLNEKENNSDQTGHGAST